MFSIFSSLSAQRKFLRKGAGADTDVDYLHVLPDNTAGGLRSSPCLEGMKNLALPEQKSQVYTAPAAVVCGRGDFPFKSTSPVWQSSAELGGAQLTPVDLGRPQQSSPEPRSLGRPQQTFVELQRAQLSDGGAAGGDSRYYYYY